MITGLVSWVIISIFHIGYRMNVLYPSWKISCHAFSPLPLFSLNQNKTSRSVDTIVWIGISICFCLWQQQVKLFWMSSKAKRVFNFPLDTNRVGKLNANRYKMVNCWEKFGTFSSLMQVTGFLFEMYWVSLQILLFRSGLWLKFCFVYYCTLILNFFL